MPEEILPGIHDITTLERDGRRYRVYLLEDDVPTLIDTGHPHTYQAVFDGIEEIGVEPERLLITHEDGDHTGAFDEVVERYDLETWVPAADREAIEATCETTPDHSYEDGDQIGRFEAVHAPGHTPGCSVFVDEAAGIALTGDVLVGSDLRGLPTGYLLPPPEIYSDDFAQAERSLENLLGYEFDVALVMHGSAVLEDASTKLEAFVEFPGKPER